MKQDPIPEGLKEPKPTPLRVCLPFAHAAAVFPVPDTPFDEFPLSDLPEDIDDALIDIFPEPYADMVEHQVDAGAYEWPHPVANSVTGLSLT
jgi:hypothetical protein